MEFDCWVGSSFLFFAYFRVKGFEKSQRRSIKVNETIFHFREEFLEEILDYLKPQSPRDHRSHCGMTWKLSTSLIE